MRERADLTVECKWDEQAECWRKECIVDHVEYGIDVHGVEVEKLNVHDVATSDQVWWLTNDG